MPKLSRLPALLAALDVEGRAVTRTEIVERFGYRAYREGRKRGSITRLVPGVYAHIDRVECLMTRLVACTRWLAGRGAVSGTAACLIYGLEPRSIPYVSVILTKTKRTITPKWIRATALNCALPTTTVSGVLVVTLECALIDAVWKLGLSKVKGLIIDAIRDNKTNSERITAALKYFPRIKHRRALVEFLTNLKGGVHSYLEYLADRDVFNVPELQQLERQVTFWVDSRKYVVDAFDRRTMTAIELDSRKHHGSEAARRRDLERDAALASIGVLTLRFTYQQVSNEPLKCRKRILDTIATRSRQLTA